MSITARVLKLFSKQNNCAREGFPQADQISQCKTCISRYVCAFVLHVSYINMHAGSRMAEVQCWHCRSHGKRKQERGEASLQWVLPLASEASLKRIITISFTSRCHHETQTGHIHLSTLLSFRDQAWKLIGRRRVLCCTMLIYKRYSRGKDI